MTTKPTPPGNQPPKSDSGTTPKPKKKLELDVNDVDSVLERKISP